MNPLLEQEYLSKIREAKESVQIPIIASLNGSVLGGWVDYAKKIEQAGADALELNIYFIPTEMDRTSIEIEQDVETGAEPQQFGL